jgi:GNAT superfamily N-acetyltransferase
VSAGDLEVRDYEPGDRPAVLELLASSLGWVPDDQHRAFFAWKHEANPFGPSLAWVAVAGGDLAGFRTFLRWEFTTDGGRVLKAVRAVDTATHPDHRGRGVFSALTRHGLAALPAAGVDFVFNTPNDQSRPGYLKMGWEVVGKLPLRARLRSPGVLPRMLGARTAAELWSVPTARGTDAATALADEDALARLLAGQPAPRRLATRRSPAFLRWRYTGVPALEYRVTAPGSTVADGVAVWRLRRRGAALEAAIVEVLAPGDDPRRRRALARAAARESGADYAIALTPHAGHGFVPLPKQGPILTWRGVGTTPRPPLAAWELGLGDVELF